MNSTAKMAEEFMLSMFSFFFINQSETQKLDVCETRKSIKYGLELLNKEKVFKFAIFIHDV